MHLAREIDHDGIEDIILRSVTDEMRVKGLTWGDELTTERLRDLRRAIDCDRKDWERSADREAERILKYLHTRGGECGGFYPCENGGFDLDTPDRSTDADTQERDKRLDAPHVSGAMRKALGKLTPDQRYLVEQHYLIGRTQTDLARERGVSQPRIATILKAAIGRLRELIPDDCCPH